MKRAKRYEQTDPNYRKALLLKGLSNCYLVYILHIKHLSLVKFISLLSNINYFLK